MKRLPMIAILCPVGPHDDPSAAFDAWSGVGDVADVVWVWAREKNGRSYAGNDLASGVLIDFPGALILYDLADCPSGDPMGREVWVRNKLYAHARDFLGVDIVISIDADEVCINPRELIRDLVDHPGVALYARWRHAVAETTGDDPIVVGPWGSTDEEILEAYNGFLVGGPAHLQGEPFLWGRALPGVQRKRVSRAVFVHRAWLHVAQKLRSWAHAADGRELLHFETRADLLQSSAIRGNESLMRMARLVGTADNWSPYPKAPWPRLAAWKTDDIKRLGGRPFWISETEATKKGECT